MTGTKQTDEQTARAPTAMELIASEGQLVLKPLPPPPLERGDLVTISFYDWGAGETTIEAEVTGIPAPGRVRLRLGSDTGLAAAINVPAEACTLVSAFVEAA